MGGDLSNAKRIALDFHGTKEGTKEGKGAKGDYLIVSAGTAKGGSKSPSESTMNLGDQRRGMKGKGKGIQPSSHGTDFWTRARKERHRIAGKERCE